MSELSVDWQTVKEDPATLRTAFDKVIKGAKQHRVRLASRQAKLARHMETAPFVRMQDKFTFVISITLMLAFTYLFGRENDGRYFTFISIFVPMLVLIRLNSYYSQGWHYYLIDFCYFATALTLVLVNFLPKNEALFRMVFLYS